MHTGIPHPLARHPHMMAKGLAALGRGGDDTLVHMSREEVQRLQQIMQQDGASLTTNPVTGLPEAYSWKDFGHDIIPFIPAGLGALTGYYLPDSPIMNAVAYGGLAKLTGADLPSAINAGLQFYGGEGLTSGLRSAFGAGKNTSTGTTGNVGTTGNTDISAGDMAHADLSNIAHPTASAGDMAHANLSNLFGSAQAPAAGASAVAAQLPTDITMPSDYAVPDAQFGLHHLAQTPESYTPSLYHRLTDTVGDAYHKVANSPFVKSVEGIGQKGENVWSGLNKAQKTGLAMAGTNILNSLTAPKPVDPAAANPARYYVSSTNQPLYSRRVNPDFLKGVPGAPPYIVTTSPGEYTTDSSRVQGFKSGGGITALAEGGTTATFPEQNNPVSMPQNQVKPEQGLPASAWTNWAGGDSYNPNADPGGNIAIAGLAYAKQHPEYAKQAIDYGLNTWFGGNEPNFMPSAPKQWGDYSDAEKIAYIGRTIPQYAETNRILQQQANNTFDTGDWNDPIGDAARGSSALWADTAYDPNVYNPTQRADQYATQKSLSDLYNQNGGWLKQGGMGGNDLGNVDVDSRYEAGGVGGNFLGDVDFSDYKPSQPALADMSGFGGAPSSAPATSDWYHHPLSSLGNAWDNTAIGGAIDSAGRYVGNALKKGEDYISNSGIGRMYHNIPQPMRDFGALIAGAMGGPAALPIIGLNLATRDNGPNYGVFNSGIGKTLQSVATNPVTNPAWLLTNPFFSAAKMGYNENYLQNHPSYLPSSSISGPENFDASGRYIADPTSNTPQTNALYKQHAAGGTIQGYAGGGGIGALENTYAAGGKLLRGPGDGMSDSIPAVIGGHKPQRAALADGEFVIPADVVSHLGNGSTEAGSRKLYAMMAKIRHARTGRKKQAPQINADKFLAR